MHESRSSLDSESAYLIRIATANELELGVFERVGHHEVNTITQTLAHSWRRTSENVLQELHRHVGPQRCTGCRQTSRGRSANTALTS